MRTQERYLESTQRGQSLQQRRADGLAAKLDELATTEVLAATRPPASFPVPEPHAPQKGTAAAKLAELRRQLAAQQQAAHAALRARDAAAEALATCEVRAAWQITFTMLRQNALEPRTRAVSLAVEASGALIVAVELVAPEASVGTLPTRREPRHTRTQAKRKADKAAYRDESGKLQARLLGAMRRLVYVADQMSSKDAALKARDAYINRLECRLARPRQPSGGDAQAQRRRTASCGPRHCRQQACGATQRPGAPAGAEAGNATLHRSGAAISAPPHSQQRQVAAPPVALAPSENSSGWEAPETTPTPQPRSELRVLQCDQGSAAALPHPAAAFQPPDNATLSSPAWEAQCSPEHDARGRVDSGVAKARAGAATAPGGGKPCEASTATPVPWEQYMQAIDSMEQRVHALHPSLAQLDALGVAGGEISNALLYSDASGCVQTPPSAATMHAFGKQRVDAAVHTVPKGQEASPCMATAPVTGVTKPQVSASAMQSGASARGREHSDASHNCSAAEHTPQWPAESATPRMCADDATAQTLSERPRSAAATYSGRIPARSAQKDGRKHGRERAKGMPLPSSACPVSAERPYVDVLELHLVDAKGNAQHRRQANAVRALQGEGQGAQQHAERAQHLQRLQAVSLDLS